MTDEERKVIDEFLIKERLRAANPIAVDLDELLGRACSRLLQAASLLNTARVALRNSDPDGVTAAIREFGNHYLAALNALVQLVNLPDPVVPGQKGGLVH